MLKSRIFLILLFFVVSCLCNLNRFFPKSKLISTESNITQHNNPQENKLSNVVQHSIQIALENCKEQFKWDRWNCPSNDFLLKRSSSIVTRETAYVQAVSIASIMHTVIKDTLIDTNTSICNDRIDYAGQIAYFEISRHSRIVNETKFVQLHNAQASRIAFQKSIQRHCKQPKSNCFIPKCLFGMEIFAEIAKHLRKMYDEAVFLKYNHYDYSEGIKATSLVYLKESPNYCYKNAIPNWKGMHGRQCSQNKDDSSTIQERKSCKNLCRKCGLRVREQKQLKNVRCNCRFNGCCVVACDVCTEYVQLFFCE